MLLDKIRVSESTKTAFKRPCSRRWVYQCRCRFALGSGYDWSSLGGEGKVTWTVIANKSGVEKQKKFCTEHWFFSLWLQIVFEEIGIFFLNIVNSRKKWSEIGKNRKNRQTTKLEKKKGKKTLVKRYILHVCVCTLNKVWKNMIVKLMMFYCKTLLTPYVKNHNQHDWHLVQTCWIWDLRPYLSQSQ